MRVADAAVLAGCACAIAAGQLLFKLAAARLDGVRTLAMVVNPYLVLGVSLYGLATLAWVWELRSVPLSHAYPFMAISFVLVPIASFAFLGEALSPGKIVGSLLIAAGILASGGPMSDFPAADIAFLKSVATGNIHTPTLYYHPNRILRDVFWMRLRMIDALMGDLGVRDGTCLDFGGGSGVFLPALARRFRQVTCMDLDPSVARLVCAHHGLPNVSVDATDMDVAGYAQSSFDVAVAADVLEHFQDLRPPIDHLLRWVKPGGFLFTSLPTENAVYLVLRALFGIEKPADHYHTAAEVEAYLASRGWRRRRRRCVPLRVPLAPLFSIVAWVRPG